MFDVIKLFVGKYTLYLQLAVVALLLAAIGVQTLRLANAELDYAHLDAVVAKERQSAAELFAKDIQHTRDIEQQLVTQGEAQRKQDEEALRALGADRDRLGRLLAARAHRPAAVAVVPAAGAVAGSGSGSGAGDPSGTGAGLYAEDGVFLAGEAAAAKRYTIALRSCLRQYEDARETLNQPTEKK